MINDLTYETAMKRIEEIVAALEKNETSLEECMKLFEEGTSLIAFCNDKLNSAQQKVTELTEE